VPEMSDSATLALGLGGIFVGLWLSLLMAGAIHAQRAQIGRSLAALRALQTQRQPQQGIVDTPFRQRILLPSLLRASQLGRRLTVTGSVERLQRRLEEAGSPAAWDVDRVLALKVLGGLALPLLGCSLALLAGLNPLTTIAIGLALGVGGFLAPNVIVVNAVNGRRDKIRRALPDTIDLLTINVEAGLAFNAALAQVARKTDGPLADELFRVLQEMQIGLGRSAALKALAERTNVPELRSFVLAMVQADTFGIPIANVLRVQAREIRVKRSQQVEEKAQKVPVKILFPLIFCIMPTLLIVVVGPAAVRILETFAGR
jgi:tight adherence protein C